jgi:hypothetical protein
MKQQAISVVLALALVAIGFVVAPASRVLAGTCTSQANGDWFTASTWGGGCTGTGGVPANGDSVTVAHTVILTAVATVGTGTVTVQSGGILNLSSYALTANTLAIGDGGEVQQGGTSGAPSGTITTRSYAANSTYTFNGTQAGLTGTHPTYGNLYFAPTPGTAGTFAVNLKVAGSMTVNLGSMQEVRFATGATSRSHNIGGNLNIQNGIVAANNGAGSATLTVGGNLNIVGGTFRGTNDAGNATLNIAGNLSNDGTWQQDDGSSAGKLTINLNGLTSSQTIGGVNLLSFEDLVIGNALGCTLNRDVVVTGQLSLTSGDITTGANTLTLAEAATTSGGGDVWGNTRRTGTLTVGKVYAFGNPNISLNFASATTMPTDVTINLVAGPPVGFAGAVNRSYTITPNGGSNYSATVRLRYLAGELGANTESRLHLWRYDGAAWQNQGQSAIDTANKWVEANGVTAFSPWALASSTPTAVTLRTLSATSSSPMPAPFAGLTLLGGLAALVRRRKA